MPLNIKSQLYHWLFIGIFSAAPFFIPEANADVVSNKGEEIAGLSVRVGGGGGYYYNDRPRRYRYYPRDGYYYRNRYPVYREYYGPYDYDRRNYRRYPRGGGSVRFNIK